MLIRLTTDRAGYGFLQLEGETIDLPAEEAERLIAAGQAERITQRIVETTAIDHRTRETRGGRKSATTGR